MKLLLGEPVATSILNGLKNHFNPINKYTIAILQVGKNVASDLYIKNKIKICKSMGIKTLVQQLNTNVTNSSLINKIKSLNNNNKINGILIHLNLPKHINEVEVLSTISPNKDIDCLNPINVGNLFLLKNKNNFFAPCTTTAILKIFEYYKINLNGKHIVVLGRSNIVTKPLFNLLLLQDATITICHSKTKNLKSITNMADILITAISKPNFINSSFIKTDAIVIDVSTN
jgi:methylenetetrahydrofolate dehydrogenase (NADP+)/methenyltetrahydrofolate cyclohydrolase